MNVVELFTKKSAEFPQKAAIIHGNRKISYSELSDEVEKTASYFLSKGITEGDRVLVFLPMSIDLYRVTLALFYVGATAVFLDEWVSWKRLRICSKIASCKGYIGTRKAKLLRLATPELRDIPLHLNTTGRSQQNTPCRQVDSAHPALITFTTGSTGTPKATVRSHQQLLHQFEALVHEINVGPNDVDLTLLPIVLLINLGIGATSVIVNYKAKKPKQALKDAVGAIDGNDVTKITGSPYFILELVSFLYKNKLAVLSLRNMVTGGAPVFPNQAKQIIDSLPNVGLTVVYGSTEAEPISAIDGNQLITNHTLKKGLPVGEVYHGTQLAIINISDQPIGPLSKENFSTLHQKPSNIGEIVVTGSHVLNRYFANQEAYQRNKIEVERTVWHRTGDSGYLQDGELYLTGRCKQLIFRNGKVISPFVVENQLAQIPEVRIGTILERESRIILVIEKSNKNSIEANAFDGFIFDEIRYLRHIPRDPRHHSKIDYEKLVGMV